MKYMRIQNYTLLVVGTLLSLILFGCSGAEDGDLTPPNFTIDVGIQSPTATADGHILSGTMDADATIDVASSNAATISNLVYGGGTWSFQLDNLQEGFNTISIDVADPAKNSNVFYLSVFLDLTGPVVTINQFTNPTSSSVQTLAGTIAELDANVEISIDGSAFAPVDDVNGGVWFHSVNLASAPLTPYLIDIRGIDNLQNPTDPANYASASITVDSAAGVFTIAEDDLGPVYLPNPDIDSTLLLNGTRETDYTIGIVSISPVSVTTIDDTTNNVVWTADFADLPSGVTEVTFGLNDLSLVEVAQSKVMIVRDLSGPLLINTDPAHGDTSFVAGSPIELTFSEEMKPIVNDGTIFELIAEDGTIIPFSTNPSTSNNRAFVFTPDPIPAPQMLPGTKYSVDFVTPVASIVEDIYGNSFVPPTSLLKFTTTP
jgi:hypothetical protein